MSDTAIHHSALRRARNDEGLSREYVARKIDVSTKTLERWENGTTPITMHRRRQLAVIYHVPVEQLLDEEAA